MGRLTPYLFFTVAAAGLVMVAVQGDAGFEEEVEPLEAILIIAGVFIAAHALRHAVRHFAKNRRSDG